MNQSIEKTALSNLITNEDYARKVIPFLKSDYFKIKEERIVFEEIQKFIDKYKKIPTKTTLEIEIENRKDINQEDHDKIVKLIVRKKTDQTKFERFVDKLYNSNVFELKIVENFQLIDNEDFEAFESENTLSILNRYVEESDIDLEKSRIQTMISDVYQEACELV